MYFQVFALYQEVCTEWHHMLSWDIPKIPPCAPDSIVWTLLELGQGWSYDHCPGQYGSTEALRTFSYHSIIKVHHQSLLIPSDLHCHCFLCSSSSAFAFPLHSQNQHLQMSCSILLLLVRASSHILISSLSLRSCECLWKSSALHTT